MPHRSEKRRNPGLSRCQAAYLHAQRKHALEIDFSALVGPESEALNSDRCNTAVMQLVSAPASIPGADIVVAGNQFH